jgi:hypothetical protein
MITDNNKITRNKIDSIVFSVVQHQTISATWNKDYAGTWNDHKIMLMHPTNGAFRAITVTAFNDFFDNI